MAWHALRLAGYREPYTGSGGCLRILIFRIDGCYSLE